MYASRRQTSPVFELAMSILRMFVIFPVFFAYATWDEIILPLLCAVRPIFWGRDALKCWAAVLGFFLLCVLVPATERRLAQGLYITALGLGLLLHDKDHEHRSWISGAVFLVGIVVVALSFL